MRGEREGIVSTDILSAIQGILKENPKGVSVTDLSKKMAMNRNSVAKYLDILLISGKVEMRSYGTAKVYYLSHRVPISSLLSFSSDFIIVIDARHTVIQVSDNFLAYAGLERECVVGRTVLEAGLPLISAPELYTYILDIPDREITLDIRHRHNGEEFFFTVKLVPTVFDDGTKGVTAIIDDTTSRIRYERALAASEEKYRGLIERNFDIILTVDRVGRVTYVSPSFSKISGFAAAEVVGRHFGEQCSTALPASTDLFNRVIAGEVIEGVEQQLPRRDGSVNTVEINAFPIRENGVVVGAQAIIRDVTKRRTAERTLHESERRFREAAELSPFPIAIIEPDGKYSFINRKFIDVFGYTLSDVPTGRKWFERAFPDPTKRREVISTWLSDRDRSKPGEVRARTFPVTCKDGSVREIIFRPVTLFDGREYLTYEDITEARRAEEEIRASNRLMHDIIDFLPDATFVVDEMGRVVAWNRSMESLTGVLRHDMLGKGNHAYAVPFYGKPRPVLIDLIDTEDPMIEPLYRTIYREGMTITAEGYVSLHQGKHRVFLQGIASPLLSADGKRIGAIESIRDITPHREIEERLAKAGSDLEQRIEERTKELVRANEVLRDETARSQSTKEDLFTEIQRFQTLVDTINDVLLIVDREGRIEFVNPWAAALLGKEQNTILSKPLSALFPPETAEGMQETIRQAIRTGKTIQRKRWILAGEHERWFDSTVAPLRDASGTGNRVMILARDITPSVQGEDLRRSEGASKENSRDLQSPADRR